MKKLIIASLFLAGVSMAGNAQSAAIAAANHATSPAIGKHPAKVAGKTNTIAAKTTTPATNKTTATTANKNVAKKTAVKTKKVAGKTAINHKKHKAHKKLAKRRTPTRKMQQKKN